MASSSMWLGADAALSRLSERTVDVVRELCKTNEGAIVLVSGWDGVGCLALLQRTAAAVREEIETKKIQIPYVQPHVVPVDVSWEDGFYLCSKVKAAQTRAFGLEYLPDEESVDALQRHYHVVFFNNHLSRSPVYLRGLYPTPGKRSIYVIPSESANHDFDITPKHTFIQESFGDLSEDEAQELLQLEARDAVKNVIERHGSSGDRLPHADAGSWALDCFLYCTIVPYLDNPVHHWRAEGLLGEGFEHSPEDQRLVHDLIAQFEQRCMIRTMGRTVDDGIEVYGPLVKKAKELFSSREERQGRRIISELPVKAEQAQGKDNIYRISLGDDKIKNLPPSLHLSKCCPNLCTLIMKDNPRLYDIQDDFFSSMKLVRVIDLSGTGITKLPSSIAGCSNLRMLSLNRCTKLETLSPSIETGLERLEVLSVVNTPLPQMMKLSLQNMHKLKALRVRESFHNLEELNLSVNNGRVFEEDFANVSRTRSWPAPVQKAHISICYEGGRSPTRKEEFARYKKVQNRISLLAQPDLKTIAKPSSCKQLEVHGGNENPLDYIIATKVCVLDYITLCDNQSDMTIYLSSFKTLKACRIERCHRIRLALDVRGIYGYHLGNVHLTCLGNLQYMCQSLLTSAFSNLKSIHIDCCQKLIALFQGTPVRLPMLKELEIKFCSRLRSIFHMEINGKAHGRNYLPALEKLWLVGLPNMTSICDGYLPLIQKLKVRGCWKLRQLPLSANATGAERVEVEGELKWWNNVLGNAKFDKEHITFKSAPEEK